MSKAACQRSELTADEQSQATGKSGKIGLASLIVFKCIFQTVNMVNLTSNTIVVQNRPVSESVNSELKITIHELKMVFTYSSLFKLQCLPSNSRQQ